MANRTAEILTKVLRQSYDFARLGRRRPAAQGDERPEGTAVRRLPPHRRGLSPLRTSPSVVTPRGAVQQSTCGVLAAWRGPTCRRPAWARPGVRSRRVLWRRQ